MSGILGHFFFLFILFLSFFLFLVAFVSLSVPVSGFDDYMIVFICEG
jgi:hypothetical protein